MRTTIVIVIAVTTMRTSAVMNTVMTVTRMMMMMMGMRMSSCIQIKEVIAGPTLGAAPHVTHCRPYVTYGVAGAIFVGLA